MTIEQIRELVKKEAKESDWKDHIVPVVNYAKKLAKILGVDEEKAELAALLHDIGRIKFGSKDHEITGIPEAEKILKEYNYPKETIDEVKHCIESHRGSKDILPRTILAQIITNADAMAHLDILPLFFHNPKKHTFEESLQFVSGKIDRDWNKKLTLPEAKQMMEEKYRAIKLILDSNKQYT